jgi:hypothetical protein
MESNYLLLMRVGDGPTRDMATRNCDIGQIGYEMAIWGAVGAIVQSSQRPPTL